MEILLIIVGFMLLLLIHTIYKLIRDRRRIFAEYQKFLFRPGHEYHEIIKIGNHLTPFKKISSVEETWIIYIGFSKFYNNLNHYYHMIINDINKKRLTEPEVIPVITLSEKIIKDPKNIQYIDKFIQEDIKLILLTK